MISKSVFDDLSSPDGRGLRKRKALFLSLLLVGLTLPGCLRRDNGLPSDLKRHLARQGITIKPVRVYAPLSSRAGYVVTQYSPTTAGSIVTALKLERIAPDDGRWALALQRAGEPPAVKEMWGITARPPQLRLKNGAQFEYLFLIVTGDGLMYLVTEYAYG